jgi:NADP-dependent alcohol dehydrogenase
MKDFQYINPCKIIFGRDKVNEVAQAVACCGKRVMFVYGQNSIKAKGLYDRIKKLLSEAGLACVEHAGVKSNPVLSHVVRGVEVARQHQVDCILAVGGGSVIDEAKIIAFGALTDKPVWDFFSKRIKPDRALPLVTVATISGTGSEMNSGAVLTNEMDRQKLGIGAWCLIPKISILDPLLTYTVPKKNMAYGSVDAFSHVLEGYFNGEVEPALIQDKMAEGLFKSIVASSLNVLADPDNYSYRADAMWSACLAHNGLLNAGRGRVLYEVHAIAHVLGALFDLAHGAAISVALPAWMELRREMLAKKISQFGREVFGLDKADDRYAHERTLERFKQWLAEIGAEVSLRELKIDRCHKPEVFEKLKSSFLAGGMRPVTDEETRQLVDRLLCE